MPEVSSPVICHRSWVGPGDVGRNATISVRAVPGAMTVPSSRGLRARKVPPPGALLLVMVRSAPPALRTVKLRVADSPDTTVPKSSVAGITDSAGGSPADPAR
jgi:hypothetical protein